MFDVLIKTEFWKPKISPMLRQVYVCVLDVQ